LKGNQEPTKGSCFREGKTEVVMAWQTSNQ